MRNRLLGWAFVAFLFAMSASEAQAQVQVGVQANLAEDTDFGIGGRLAGMLPANPSLKIVGSFDVYFPDEDFDYWELNGNALYMIRVLNSSVAPYVGGGLNIGHVSRDTPGVGGSDTDLGLNLLGGLEFGIQQTTVFVEAKLTVDGADQFVLTGGLYF